MAHVTPSQFYYEVGSSVMLTCSIPVSYYIDTDVITNIQWNNNIAQSISIESNIKKFNHSIILNQLKLSDAGEYNCTYYFASADENIFVISSDRKTVTNNISIKSKYIYLFFIKLQFLLLVPNRVRPTIHPLKTHYEVASNVILSCSVTYPQSDLNDVATNMILQWFNYSNHVLSVHVGPLTDYATLNYTISNVKLSDAGQYNCSSFINTTTDNPFILTSNTMTNMVSVSIISKWILNYYVIIVF